jgi:hypothetical protein
MKDSPESEAQIMGSAPGRSHEVQIHVRNFRERPGLDGFDPSPELLDAIHRLLVRWHLGQSSRWLHDLTCSLRLEEGGDSGRFHDLRSCGAGGFADGDGGCSGGCEDGNQGVSLRMQGNPNHGLNLYRCVFSAQYALANKVDHPRSVYVKVSVVIPELDGWIAGLFTPENLVDTVDQFVDASEDDHDGA